MSAYATSLMESPKTEIIAECLRQKDRAEAAEKRVCELISALEVAEGKHRRELSAAVLRAEKAEAELSELREKIKKK